MKRVVSALILFVGIAGTSHAAGLPGVYTNRVDHVQARVTKISMGQGNQFLAPQHGDFCVAAHVVVHNLGRRADPGGAGTFEIVASKGISYWQSGGCPVRQPYLPARPIAPHAMLAGWVTIELPQALHRAALGWTDGGRLNPPGLLTQLRLSSP